MKRPVVIVNGAMSADGKTALPSGRQLRISSEEDIARVYRLRNDCDAVLVGVGTVLADDPKLTVKETYVKEPRQPLRVVLDSNARTPPDSLVLNDSARTLLVVAPGKERSFGKKNVEVVGCPVDENGLLEIPSVLDLLYQRDVRRLLVEGGGTVIWSFLRSGLVDDLYVFVGPLIVGGRGTPTLAAGKGAQSAEETVLLRLIEASPVGPGMLLHFQPR